MAELPWPKLYHPAHYEGDAYVVDDTLTVEGYQLQPGTWDSLATWCGAVRILDADGNQALAIGSLAPEHTAHLGDFVMAVAGGHEVSRADGHYQRWAAVETPDPGQ